MKTSHIELSEVTKDIHAVHAGRNKDLRYSSLLCGQFSLTVTSAWCVTNKGKKINVITSELA